MPNRSIIVIGGSAGGYEAVREVLANVPAQLPASIFVTLHFPSSDPEFMAAMFARAGPLDVKTAEDGERFRPAQVYLARADHHLLLKRHASDTVGSVRLFRGPTENRFRPAIDPMFRSAAAEFRNQVIGIVLSGALDDGTSGLAAIKRCGGMAIVQDPADARYQGMPLSALRHVDADYTLKAKDIGSKLAELVREAVSLREAPPVPADLVSELAVLEQSMNGMEENQQLGVPSALTCPECGGALWEVDPDNVPRYRCHVGHSFTEQSMVASQSESLERALWASVVALQERRKLFEALLNRARRQNLHKTVKDLERKIANSTTHSAAIRKMLLHGKEFSQEEARG